MDVVNLIAPDSTFVVSQLVPRLLKMYGSSKLFKNRVIVLNFAKVCGSPRANRVLIILGWCGWYSR